jgi:hypothetical protein
MKYLIVVILVLLCALAPWFCGSRSVDLCKERFQSVCAELGMNERPFETKVGYLESSLRLREPFSTTVSSLGLRPEVVDLFRDKTLNVSTVIYNGPKKLMWGAGVTFLSLGGPDWKVSCQEWLTNRLDGGCERVLKFDDCAGDAGGLVLVFQNCVLRESKSGRFGGKNDTWKFGADNFALWPGVAAAGLSSESRSDGRVWENRTAASLLKLFESRLSNLVFTARAESPEKGRARYALGLKASELALDKSELGETEIELNFDGPEPEVLRRILARTVRRGSLLDSLKDEDPARIVRNFTKAELTAAAKGQTPFTARVSLSFKNESAPSSWEELFAGLCLEAEFEGGNVPDFWGLPALAGDGNKIVITCGQDKLLINGKEKR